MITSRIRPSEVLQSPYISIKSKVIMPGKTNGKPNIKYEDKFILAPSAKKIVTYIRNQLFGSDLLTQTEGLDINWIMPALSQAFEESLYNPDHEAFIYIHQFDSKVYLECLKKCEIHNLVQKFDKVISCDIIEEYSSESNEYILVRHIENKNGRSTIKYQAFEKDSKGNENIKVPLNKFNKIVGTDLKEFYNLNYECIVNIDTGQFLFKDSEKLIMQEMNVLNTYAEEIEKTKTRIVTTQHYQTGDIVSKWTPTSNMYDIKTIDVNNLQDYFTLLPGDRDHQMFEFLQGDLRDASYINTFKFYDYQIIQMANLSVATFGYEKDSYQNKASVDMNMNTTEMTIEAIKKQIEPQINNLIENIIKLQRSANITINEIPNEISWEYGESEKLTDMKKIEILSAIQRTASVPYEVRSKVITPILNKLIDEPLSSQDLVKIYDKENKNIKIEYEGEI